MSFWKKIITFGFLLGSLLPGFETLAYVSETQESGLAVELEKEAAWIEKEEGLACITLTQRDVCGEEVSHIGKTDYMFMFDISRTTTINDYWIIYGQKSDGEPSSKHYCPCLNKDHCYFVQGTPIQLLTYDSGFFTSNGVYVSGFADRYSLWHDEAHYDQKKGKYINIRYANGCEDIFTYSKNNITAMVEEIEERNDGSRVGFWGYGDETELWNRIDLTTDYEAVKEAIATTPMYPGSYYSTALKVSKEIAEKEDRAKTLKVIMLGDGLVASRDASSARTAAAQLCNTKGVEFYTIAVGTIENSMGHKYMKALSGKNAVAIYKNIEEEMKKNLLEITIEPVPSETQAIEKVLVDEIELGNWELDGEIECTGGKAYWEENHVIWEIPEGAETAYICKIYIKLKEESRAVEEKQELPTNELCELTYKIQGGKLHGEEKELYHESPTLEIEPQAPVVEVFEVEEGTGIFKADERTYFVRENLLFQIQLDSSVQYGYSRWTPTNHHIEIQKELESQSSTFEAFLSMDEKSQKEIREEEMATGFYSQGMEWNRSSDCKELFSDIKGKLLEDKAIYYCYPQAKIIGEELTKVSEMQKEQKLTLICDGTPPELNLPEIDRVVREESKFKITATDDGSGMSEEGIKATLINLDTGETRIWMGTSSDIEVLVDPKDEFFAGKIQLVVEAKDRVGNESREEREFVVFSVNGKIERNGEEKEPIFFIGETGTLTIDTLGYVEKLDITYPEELKVEAEEVLLNMQMEESYTRELTIPLSMANGYYEIKVEGYKDGEKITCYLQFQVVGNILDTIRTRIR